MFAILKKFSKIIHFSYNALINNNINIVYVDVHISQLSRTITVTGFHLNLVRAKPYTCGAGSYQFLYATPVHSLDYVCFFWFYFDIKSFVMCAFDFELLYYVRIYRRNFYDTRGFIQSKQFSWVYEYAAVKKL